MEGLLKHLLPALGRSILSSPPPRFPPPTPLTSFFLHFSLLTTDATRRSNPTLRELINTYGKRPWRRTTAEASTPTRRLRCSGRRWLTGKAAYFPFWCFAFTARRGCGIFVPRLDTTSSSGGIYVAHRRSHILSRQPGVILVEQAGAGTGTRGRILLGWRREQARVI